MNDLVGLRSEPWALGECVERLRIPSCGGLVVFEGTTRSPSGDKEVVALEYEAYESLAESQMRELVSQAKERWPVGGIVLLHRTGRVPTSQSGVLVAVAAPHRGEAFAACQWLIDSVKSSVAIWKKEVFDDGTSKWIGVA